MKKLDFNHINNYIESNGCKLILNNKEEKNLINVKTNLNIVCKCKNIFSKNFNNFKRNPRCKECGKKILSESNKKITIDYIKKECKKINYKCVSNEYINKKEKLNFICNNEHSFSMLYSNFQQGKRCPICKNVNKKSIYEIKPKIEEIGYKLISEKYINNKTKLKLLCPEKHICYISYNNLIAGSRCRECFFNSISGENHCNYNYNREEIKLNKRLRIYKNKSWILKNLKEDKNYNDYNKKKSKYHIDHIIPIYAFSKYIIEKTYQKNLLKKL